jgi:hypothetical protein
MKESEQHLKDLAVHRMTQTAVEGMDWIQLAQNRDSW